MIIYDTSAWIEMFRSKDEYDVSSIATHQMVLGELILGGVPAEFLMQADRMIKFNVDPISKVIEFIQAKNLTGKGIGLVDCFLLYSAIHNDCKIKTFDKDFKNLCERFEVAA